VSEKTGAKLVVDGMLGRMARWLRILGFDTLYNAAWDDFQLVQIARDEDRVLLTRDRELAMRRGARSLLVEHEVLADQLRQVVSQLSLRVDHPFSRCSVCNQPLADVAKDQVDGRVPPYVFREFDRFRICTGCKRIYWRGSHWERMRALLLDERLICAADTL
jgi:uncharacterized protein with PIN domain